MDDEQFRRWLANHEHLNDQEIADKLDISVHELKEWRTRVQEGGMNFDALKHGGGDNPGIQSIRRS